MIKPCPLYPQENDSTPSSLTSPLEDHDVVLHVGLHKCASTYLQRQFFANLPNINYIGITSRDPNLQWIARRVALFDEPTYQRDLPQLKEDLKRHLDLSLPTLISSEAISGTLHPMLFNADRRRIAQRFQDIFPSARVLLIIRNQITWHQSSFPQLCQFRSFNAIGGQFQDWIGHHIDIHKKGLQSQFHYTDYRLLIEIYEQCFRETKVLLFEDIVQDFQKSILNEVIPFLKLTKEHIQHCGEEKLNSRHNRFTLHFKQNSPKLFKIYDAVKYRTKLWCPPLHRALQAREEAEGPIDVDYLPEHLDFLKGYYGPINRFTSEHLGRDLGEMGYPV